MRALAGAMLSRKQSAEYLGVSLSTFEKCLAKGLLKPRKIGRRAVFFKEDLDEFLRTFLREDDTDEEIVRKKMKEALG